MYKRQVFFLCLCSIYPFIWIFRYVACDYNGFKSTFTGWKNFERMLNDKVFWNSVMHTFEYAFYKLIFIIPLALLMAVLLNQKLRGSSVFRGIYFMPTIISTSIAGMIFGFIFATKNGILNSMLQNMHMICLLYTSGRAATVPVLRPASVGMLQNPFTPVSYTHL